MKSVVCITALLVVLLFVQESLSCRRGEGHCGGGCRHHGGPRRCHRPSVCQLKFTNASFACQEDCPQNFQCEPITGTVPPRKAARMAELGLDVSGIRICTSMTPPVECTQDSDCASGEACEANQKQAKVCVPERVRVTSQGCGTTLPGESCSLACDPPGSSCLTGVCMARMQGGESVCLPQCKAFVAAYHRRRHGRMRGVGRGNGRRNSRGNGRRNGRGNQETSP